MHPRSLINNASWRLVASVWGVLFGLFITPFLIRHLGIHQYGLYLLASSITGVMGFMSFGLGDAALKYIAGLDAVNEIKAVNRIVGASLTMSLVLAVITTVILYLLAPLLAGVLVVESEDVDLIVTVLRITALGLAVNILRAPLGAIPQAVERFDLLSKLDIAQNFIRTVGCIIVVSSGMGLIGLVAWNLVIAVIYSIGLLYLGGRLVAGLSFIPRLELGAIRELLSYGVFVTLSDIMTILWRQGDRLLLGVYVSPASVAYLASPLTIVMAVTSTLSSAARVLFPRFSTLGDNVSESATLYLRAIWAMMFLSLVILVPMIVLMPRFLELWISQEFAANSATIAQFVGASFLVRGAFPVYTTLFQGIGKPQYLTLLYTLSAISALVLSVVLIPILGLQGAIYAYWVSAAYGVVTTFLAWKLVLKQRCWGPLLRSYLLPAIAGGLLIALFSGWGLGRVGSGWLGLTANGLIISVITAVALTAVEVLFGGRFNHLLFFIQKYLGRRVPSSE